MKAIKKVAYKVAKGTLASVHFTADTVCEISIRLEMKLDKDVDPVQVAADRNRKSYEARMKILTYVSSKMSKAKDIKDDVVDAIIVGPSNIESPHEVVMMESVTINQPIYTPRD